MDHGFEALVGFAGAHGSPFELLELAIRSSRSGGATCTCRHPAGWLSYVAGAGDDNLRAALVKIGADVVAVEDLLGELGAFDQRGGTDAAVAVSWRHAEADKTPSAPVGGRIFIVIQPFERPMAWL